jgi:hypothetical protein
MSQGILCGKSYNTQGELRKHLRNQHPSASKFKHSLRIRFKKKN